MARYGWDRLASIATTLQRLVSNGASTPTTSGEMMSLADQRLAGPVPGGAEEPYQRPPSRSRRSSCHFR